MSDTVTKVDDTTIKIASGPKERTITITELLAQKTLLTAKIANFDLRFAADRLALENRLDKVQTTIDDAVAAGIILPS